MTFMYIYTPMCMSLLVSLHIIKFRSQLLLSCCFLVVPDSFGGWNMKVISIDVSMILRGKGVAHFQCHLVS